MIEQNNFIEIWKHSLVLHLQWQTHEIDAEKVDLDSPLKAYWFNFSSNWHFFLWIQRTRVMIIEVFCLIINICGDELIVCVYNLFAMDDREYGLVWYSEDCNADVDIDYYHFAMWLGKWANMVNITKISFLYKVMSLFNIVVIFKRESYFLIDFQSLLVFCLLPLVHTKVILYISYGV